MAANPDSRRARSEATQAAMMRAAEKLIAERGVENVSIRDIVSAAGQKNESALQYHFKNFAGLLRAIHAERAEETQSRRSTLITTLLETTAEPSLRDICMLMVRPSFELAQHDAAYRRYVKAFGHELVLADTSPLAIASRQGGGGASGQQMGTLLRQTLSHLDEESFRRRMDAAVRLCASSMYHQAKQKNAFRGQQADLFLHSLIDALAGLLSAPESNETRALARAVSRD